MNYLLDTKILIGHTPPRTTFRTPPMQEKLQ